MDNSDSKQPYSSVQLRAVNNGHDIGDIDQQAAAATWATANDVHDMDALGLEPTFKRRFRFVAMVGFTSVVVVAWQATLSVFFLRTLQRRYWRTVLGLRLLHLRPWSRLSHHR